MSSRPGTAALFAALRDRRRNATALVVALAAIALAVVAANDLAYYAAGLVVFAVWMVWFVMTAIEWVRRAEF